MRNLKYALLPALILAAGCATKTKILDAGAVSMTHQYLQPGESLKETGPVTGQFCADSMHDKGSIGLMDEAIRNAQEQSGADYITNAAFYLSGAGCVSVEGTGNKVIASAADTSDSPDVPKHETKKKKHK